MKDKLLKGPIEIQLVSGPEALNEDFAQTGDKVIYQKQKGYVIGQASNGDLLIQIQGSSVFAKPSEVKVLGVKAKTLEPPFKFDEKTQKVLFEQFVRCGIFVGNTPVKTSNCYVKYSQWRDAKMNENINVISDGQLNIMPKEQVRVFDDPNIFANPEDYVKGVIIDEQSGKVIENIKLNAIDFTNAIGDSDPVRVIRDPEGPNTRMETLPKAILDFLPGDKS